MMTPCLGVIGGTRGGMGMGGDGVVLRVILNDYMLRQCIWRSDTKALE